MQITKVFNYLNENKIQYFIIEINKTKKEIQDLSGEIDVVIDKKDFYKVIKYLKKENWKSHYNFQVSGLKRIQLIKRDFLSNSFFKLDILNSFFHESNNKIYSLEPFQQEFDVIQNRTYLKGFNLYLLSLLKYSLEKKNKNLINIIEKIKEDDFLRTQLTSFVNNEITLNNFINKIKDKRYIKKHRASLKFDFFKKVFNFINRYILLTKTPFIGFIGLDGSGKSTIISIIQKEINLLDISCETVYMGHKDFEFGFMKKIQSKTNKTIIDNLIYIVFWPVEIRTRINKALKTSNFILFDRHPSFEPLLPKKSKFILLNLLYKFISYILIPSPKITFFLTGNNFELWERKKEDSFIDYEKRVFDLKKIIKESSIKIFSTKTDVALNDSVNNIKKIIFEHFSIIR